LKKSGEVEEWGSDASSVDFATKALVDCGRRGGIGGLYGDPAATASRFLLQRSKDLGFGWIERAFCE
jgi:hypothetical protein